MTKHQDRGRGFTHFDGDDCYVESTPPKVSKEYKVLRDILVKLYLTNHSVLSKGLTIHTPSLAVAEAEQQIKQLIPTEPNYPIVDEYLRLVEKAKANGKYDDMFEFGYLKAIDDFNERLGKK